MGQEGEAQVPSPPTPKFQTPLHPLQALAGPALEKRWRAGVPVPGRRFWTGVSIPRKLFPVLPQGGGPGKGCRAAGRMRRDGLWPLVLTSS